MHGGIVAGHQGRAQVGLRDPDGIEVRLFVRRGVRGPVEPAYVLPGPGGADVLCERAAAATSVLDLVDATGGT